MLSLSKSVNVFSKSASIVQHYGIINTTRSRSLISPSLQFSQISSQFNVSRTSNGTRLTNQNVNSYSFRMVSSWESKKSKSPEVTNQKKEEEEEDKKSSLIVEGDYVQSAKNVATKTVSVLAKIPSLTTNFIINIPRHIREFPENWKIWWPKIKHELHHYWVGSKLFVLQARTAKGILYNITQGKELSRRERKILITTFNDFLRLIPFTIIVIVPFMEFALPFLLRLFPNMLPSTFEDKLKKEESLKKNLKARIGFAKFLQDAAEELVKNKPQTDAKDAQPGVDVAQIMRKVREGEPVSNDEILHFATAFSDELTLDNLPREQLKNMCKYMGMSTIGPDEILRFQLTQKLRHLKSDDVLIQREGIDSLTIEELQAALRARGMRGTSNNKLVLRRRLSEWLDLSLTHNLPASVLILSRAMVITEKATYEDKLKETLSSLPDDLVEEVRVKIDESQGKKVSSDLKYEILKSQNKQLQEEDKKEEEKVDENAEEMKEVGEAVSVLSSRPLKKEREELSELRADHAELVKETEKQELSATSLIVSQTANDILSSVSSIKREEKPSVVEDILGKQLRDRLSVMVTKLEEEVETVENAVGMKLNVLDKDKDGVISVDELADALNLMRDKLSPEKVNEIISKVDRDHDGKISLEELIAFVDEHSKSKNENKK
uniref:Mitochondrial proton/calcium exchanger protein n=1 Tax=Hordeum vulgare subsp. vulgare TaxID=112509 RepID=F2E510_HORVV|nr:predicted protein [Hordeum vulgare subsp. vulgare]